METGVIQVAQMQQTTIVTFGTGQHHFSKMVYVVIVLLWIFQCTTNLKQGVIGEIGSPWRFKDFILSSSQFSLIQRTYCPSSVQFSQILRFFVSLQLNSVQCSELFSLISVQFNLVTKLFLPSSVQFSSIPRFFNP